MHPDGPDDAVGLQAHVTSTTRKADRKHRKLRNKLTPVKQKVLQLVQFKTELMKVIILSETFIQYVGLS